jgi:hypothetical protein
MRTHLLILISRVLATATLFTGCNTDDDDLFKTATIKHNGGIDWSTGQTATTDENMDGETIAWCELGTQVSGVEGLWYRTWVSDPIIYRLGDVSLSSITTFDPSMAATDLCATPLAVGDVYAVKCHDGYAAFKVTGVDPVTSEDWAVDVEYIFSTTVNF